MLTIERLTVDQLRDHQAGLVVLIQDVVNGGASISFLPPLDAETAAAYWSKVAAEVANGERIVLAAFDGDTNNGDASRAIIVGSAQLDIPRWPPNGQHRTSVEKVMVSSAFRQQGIGKRLMLAIEQTAREAGKTLLVLDTERGSAAEHLYTSTGYTQAGIIPAYALDSTGKLIDTVVYYRQL